MNGNIEKSLNQKPKRKYEFGKAFENIILFPFKVLSFLIKWSFRAIVGIIIIFILYLVIHGALPMQIPEAHGVSYYGFMIERHQTMKQSHPDLTLQFEIQMFTLVNSNYFILKLYELPFCLVFPNSKNIKKMDICSPINRPFLKMFMSAHDELNWTDLPSLMWETYERFLWETYVKSIGLKYPNFSLKK